jgi:hypothetical protein
MGGRGIGASDGNGISNFAEPCRLVTMTRVRGGFSPRPTSRAGHLGSSSRAAFLSHERRSINKHVLYACIIHCAYELQFAS